MDENIDIDETFENPFENLDFPPKIAIANSLDACHLVLVSLISEKWEDVVKHGGERKKAVWDVYMTEDEVKIRLGFAENNMPNPQNVEMSFKEDSSTETHVRLEGSNFIVSYHNTTDHLETSCFKVLQLISLLFPPISYDNVILFLDSRSPVFPFRFLSQLPRGTAEQVTLYGDQQVDGKDLVQFLKNVQVKNKNTGGIRVLNALDIGVRIGNLVTSDEIQIDNSLVTIADARFLTRKSLLNMKFSCGEIGENDFTSQDFHAFLRMWMDRNGLRALEQVTFALREDQKITLEEVTEGLHPYVGKPRIRDRWHITCPAARLDEWLYPTATDLDQGWDIQNSLGFLGVILLEPNRLSFFVKLNRFTWFDYLKVVEGMTEVHRRGIEAMTRHRETLERKIADGREELSAADLAFLEKFPEMIGREQQIVAKGIDMRHNLLTVWNND